MILAHPSHGRRLALSLLAVLVVALCTYVPAHADGDELDSCMATGSVWLLVVDADQRVLANQCVGNPDTGEDALRAGGLSIRKARNGVICSLGGVPEKCPRVFRGEFWHYYHAQQSGAYVFSDLGPMARKPPASSIEAWCYNPPEERRCTPPAFTDDAALPVTTNTPVPAEVGGSPIPLVVSAAAVLVLGTGVAIWQRRQRRNL